MAIYEIICVAAFCIALALLFLSGATFCTVNLVIMTIKALRDWRAEDGK